MTRAKGTAPLTAERESSVPPRTVEREALRVVEAAQRAEAEVGPCGTGGPSDTSDPAWPGRTQADGCGTRFQAPDPRISGGVFVVSGAFVDSVRNGGPVTTYGPNDMVLDNWGMVGHWTTSEKVTSYGPSGI